jgi:hypothetical protein
LWEPLLAGTLVVAGLFMVGVVVVGFIVFRYGRRKWRAFHSHGLVVGAVALWEATSSSRLGRRASLADAHDEDVRQWTSRRLRKELCRAVERADAAVGVAAEAGAPTASLPGLCRRLHEVSTGLDRVLRIGSAGPVPDDVASQAIEVMQAAAQVERAAVASANDANGQRVRDLVCDADHEVQCLGAGLASAQAALPDRDR